MTWNLLEFGQRVGKGARNPANSCVGFHSFLRCVTVAFERQGGAETDR